VRGPRQHAVLGGDPSLTASAQKAGHPFFDARRAQHARATEFDQHRTFGVAGEVTLEVDGTQRVGAAATRPSELGHGNELIEKRRYVRLR